MNSNLPELTYMILFLPGLFGLVLFSEGVNKIVHKEGSGYISLSAGLVFLFGTFIAYLLFSTYLL